MREVEILSGERFSLVSYGNGWAYKLTDSRLVASLWLQDESALYFRKELDALEEAKPNVQPDTLLSFLASNYADCFEAI